MKKEQTNISKLASIIVLFFMLGLATTLFGQTIRNVDFTITKDNKVVVTYSISGIKTGDAYNISLLVSTDGGRIFRKVHKVTGDVGMVKSPGRKRIVWNVLAERQELVTDKLICRVEGSEVRTYTFDSSSALNTFRTLFLGSDATKKRSDGSSVFGGYYSSGFMNRYFSQMVEIGFLNPKPGYVIGYERIGTPLIFEISAFWQVFDDQDQLFRNVDLDPDIYNEGYYNSYALLHRGVAFSISYTVLPFMVYILPHIGIGYQLSSFDLQAGGEAKLASATSAGFYLAGIHLNLFSHIKFSISFNHSFPETYKAWEAWYISIHIG